jgi:hypothetical protein
VDWSLTWNAVTAIATAVSMVAFVITALYVRGELKAIEKDRYLAITNQLFALWETPEFMDAQLWLLHRLEVKTWPDFVRDHRADVGEAAFHRVGGFYDRVGALVRLGFVRQEDILTTIGAQAVAVWNKIEPLVREARQVEHSTLFCDFERLLPACYECYVPALASAAAGPAPQATGRAASADDRIRPGELKRGLDRGEALTVLDVRPADQVARDPHTLPGAVVIPPDAVPDRHRELPRNRELITYCA